MNERIKELYNQSLEEKYQYGGSDAKPGEMYSNYITVLNPEKFAELIVRECAKEAFEFWCSQDDPTEGSAENHILKRFGVEE
jgi:hypothetical protein